MFDREKNPVGRISLDLRHLTAEAVMKEKEDFLLGKTTNNLGLIEAIAAAHGSYFSSMYSSLL